MAHWCLRDVDYDTIDFLQHCQLHTEDVCRQCEWSLTSRDTDFPTAHRLDSNDTSLCQHRVLRCAVLNSESRHNIPHIVASWPYKLLRLHDIVLPEECDRYLETSDDIWTLLFQGLVLMSRDCRLQRLDLTGFVPSRGLIYTFLQLVPFLSLEPDQLVAEHIYNITADKLNAVSGVVDSQLLHCVHKYLDSILTHNIFKRASRKRLHLPLGGLEVVIDFLPVNSQTLPFICYLVSDAISHLTRVNIVVNSFIYTFCNSEKFEYDLEMTTDPLTPLLVASNSLTTTRVRGFALQNISAISSITAVLQQLTNNVATTSSGYSKQLTADNWFSTKQNSSPTKLSLEYCHIDLSNLSHCQAMRSFISAFTAITRLDLSGTYINGRLKEILARIGGSGLEYLRLSHCCLELSDIDELLLSSSVQTIRDLDLSYVFSPHCANCSQRRELSGRKCRQMSEQQCWTTVAGKQDHESGTGSSLASPLYDRSVNASVETVSDGFWSTAWNMFLSSDNEDSGEISLGSDKQQQQQQQQLQQQQVLQQHSADRTLVEHAIRCIAKCELLTIVDVSNDCFTFRVSDSIFTDIVHLSATLRGLRHLSIESFPFWDDDILAFAASVTDSHSQLQSVAMSRSREAPRTKISDRFAFWKRLHDSKQGKRLRISVDNFIPDSSVISPSDDDTLELCTTLSGSVSD